MRRSGKELGGNLGSPGIPVVTGQNSLSRRARPLELLGRPRNAVLFSREFRKSRNLHGAPSHRPSRDPRRRPLDTRRSSFYLTDPAPTAFTRRHHLIPAMEVFWWVIALQICGSGSVGEPPRN